MKNKSETIETFNTLNIVKLNFVFCKLCCWHILSCYNEIDKLSCYNEIVHVHRSMQFIQK